MSDSFGIGDKVRVTDVMDPYYNLVGKVTDVLTERDWGVVEMRVDLGNDIVAVVDTRHLELARG